MSSFKDVAQLINGPEYPNSVQWADDGTLAVAEGSCVGILHPGSLGGAQAFAAIDGFAQDTVIAAPGKPNGACIHFDMALSLRVLLSPVKESTGGGKGGKSQKEPVSNQSRRPPASSKAIAWSPSGAGTSGGCLLATVTNDYRVIIFGPDSKLDPEWRPIFTVHENLLNHLTKTKWKSIDAVTLRASGAVLDGSSSSDDSSSSSSSSSDSSSSSSSDSDSDDEAAGAAAPAAAGDKKKKEEEEVLRLRGGAGGSSDGEDTSTEDTEDEEEKQAPKKKQKISPAAAKRKPAAAASKAQKQVETKPAPAPTNRRKPAAPQVAPAGDATDLGGDTTGPSSVSTAADAALTAKAVLAGIPPVEFHKDRLAKLDIADTVAKRFFELRRQQDPKSLPVYPKTSSHLTGMDKAMLEKATEEYSQVYGERLKELGFDDKKKFWQECRIALPRCWNKQRNVFLEGFEETIGMGLGPGGEVQEYEEESDSEATESEEEGADGEGGRKHKLRKRRAAAAAVVTADVPAEGGADETKNASPSAAPTQKGEKKRKRVPDPVFQRAAFEYPTTTATATATEGEEGAVAAAANPPFTWRDLPPVNNANRTTLKNTLIEGAVKRFFRLRAAEPAELLPTYPTPKAYPKGVDAWIIDRVIKEYMHAHAPAMAALQYDAKKFTGFFNTRLRQVWDRSGGSTGGGGEPSGGVSGDPSSSAAPFVFLEESFDFNSDDVRVHPEGSGEGGLLGPVPIHDKVDPSAGKKAKAAPKPSKTVPKPPAVVVVGGGSAGAGTSAAAAAAVPAAAAPAAPARTKGSGGSVRAAAPRTAAPARGGTAGRSRYDKDSLGGSQWWGGTNINSDVYERRLLSISAISVAWSPAVDITINTTTTDGNAPSSRVERCSFLAVGTKEGSIWLWRCRHPAVAALPKSVEEESASLKERMALIGRLPGNLAWADTMKWVAIPSGGNGGAGGDGASGSGGGAASSSSSSSASVLVLVAGTSDGAVTLWGTDSSALAAYSTSATTSAQQKEREKEAPMEKWNTLQQSDLTQVISIDACLRYNSTGNDAMNTTTTTTSGNINSEVGVQLVVALGKSAGIVAAWTSPEFSSSDSTSTSPSASTEKIKVALQQPGQLLKTPEPSGLGSSSVTGVGLAAGGEMVIACTREGALESWSLPLRVGNTTTAATAANIASGSNGGGGGSNGSGAVVGGLQPRAAPVPCSVRRKQKESGFGSFGVAISPGGMFLAIPKNALPAGIDFVKQLQVWQRLTLGLLHLHRIAGPGAEVDGFAAAILVCKNWAARKIPAAAIWDVVNLCRIQEGLASNVAEALETEFFEIQRDVGKDVKTLLPSDVSLYAWRLLKAAVTLRRVEAAAAVTAAAKNEAVEIPHQELLDRDQMLLLQRQLVKLLASGSGNANNASGGRETEQQEQQQLQRLLAADCVVANAKHKDLMIGLLSLAVKAYHEAGETPPGEANAFAIPSRDGGELLEHRPVAMVGGSASAALTTMFHEEGQAVVVHRCPATLEVSFGAGKWVCRGCQRAYNQVPEEEERQDGGGGGGSGPPECVMCAGLLGPYGPDFLLIPPCI